MASPFLTQDLITTCNLPLQPRLFLMTFRFSSLLICLLALATRGHGQAGAKLWEFTTGAEILSSPAVGADGTIYFGSYDQAFYAINPTNGTQLWRLSVDPKIRNETAYIFSSPAIGPDGTLYFGTDQRSGSSGSASGKLYAVKPDGTVQWVHPLPDSIYSDPAVGADGTIYVGCFDTNLYAFRPNGTEQWRFKAGDQIYSDAVIGLDGTVYFGCDDGKLYALNPNGTKKWEFVTGVKAITASPALGADGTIYVGVGSAFNPKLFAVRPDGTKKWEFTTGGQVNSSAAVGPDGTIYFGSSDHKLYALTPEGTKKWEFATGGAVRSSPALAADGTILVGADDGVIYAITANGTEKWRFTTLGAVYSSPIVARNGTVYVGSGEGRFYALGGGSGLAVSAWPMFRRNHRHTAKYFPSPILTPNPGAGGLMQLLLRGEPGQNYEVETSVDLIDWHWLGSFLSFSAETNVVDFGSAGIDKRFYRGWSR